MKGTSHARCPLTFLRLAPAINKRRLGNSGCFSNSISLNFTRTGIHKGDRKTFIDTSEENEIIPVRKILQTITTPAYNLHSIQNEYLYQNVSLFNVNWGKDTVRRFENISSPSQENKIFVLNIIDMALRDFKPKKA